MRIFLIRYQTWALIAALATGNAVHGQQYADSTGLVPPVRPVEVPQFENSSWWQQVAHGHLFDFSGETGTVFVDPVIQAFGGTMQGTPNQSVWDNIRGARFQATIDDLWHAGGELLERQGVAHPELGYWAAQHRIPGWGRSKLGREQNWNTWDQAYFDVSRARGWIGWNNQTWSADAGIDALHVGAGRRSAFISREAVPAPYIRVIRQNSHGRISLSTSRWMGITRGPIGETAESLLDHSTAIFATSGWQIGPHFWVELIAAHVRENTQSDVPEGWENLGYNGGEQYHAVRNWGGVDVQYHLTLPRDRHLIAYGQTAWDAFGPGFNSIPSTSNRGHSLAHLLGMTWSGNSWKCQFEWYRQTENQCRDCFEFTGPDGQTMPTGPAVASLNNAGISILNPWNHSATAFVQVTPLRDHPLCLTLELESNDRFQWMKASATWTVQPTWPWALFAAYMTGTRIDLDSPYGFSILQVGVQAGI